jgi:hypothetical protein
MGLYYVRCRDCQENFHWFSGNLDQRCESCIKRSVDQWTDKMKEGNMKNDLEMQLIESLKATIKAKDDFIESLKKEIARLSSVATIQYPSHTNVPNGTITLQPGENGGGFITVSPQPMHPYTVIGSGGIGGVIDSTITAQNNSASQVNGTGLAYKYTNERDGL